MRNPMLIAALCLAAPLLTAAQNSAPAPTPIAQTIPLARDVPYPGTIRLEVDATDISRAIFKVRETIPVNQPGRLTLLLPQWIPGNHAPRGQIDKIAGFEVFANGQKLTWARDPVDVYAYHIEVPAGAREVEARFNFLSATQPNQGRVVVTPEIINLQWFSVSLYPAGYHVRRIPITASLTLPSGWQAATALRPMGSAATGANRITYGEVSYETLQDSPVFAGKYFRRDPLGHNVFLNSFADSPKELAVPANVLAKHRAMVDQAIKLFGSRHYDHYDFLNAVTDQLGGIGVEHHRSTEITTDPGYFIKHEDHLLDRNVFPHEFVHSWDGKYRRPAGHIVPDYRTPLRNELMWVYEGQTQLWGNVLEARSGMSSKDEVLGEIARVAAALDNQAGRRWRPLVDTTYDPIIQKRQPEPWGSFQRNEDYYQEGMLIWIEADAIIRQGTRGRRGLDDFARAFFGVKDGDWGVLPYTREDVIKTLNRVYAYDWTRFLHERVDLATKRPPLAGLERSGYRLAYSEEPSAITAARIKASQGGADFYYSLGFNVSKDKKLTSVRWDGPAFERSMRIGDELIAVEEKAYSNEALSDAITAARNSNQPIRLIVKRGDTVRTIDIAYHGGLRYPRLVKTGRSDGPLDLLLRKR